MNKLMRIAGTIAFLSLAIFGSTACGGGEGATAISTVSQITKIHIPDQCPVELVDSRWEDGSEVYVALEYDLPVWNDLTQRYEGTVQIYMENISTVAGFQFRLGGVFMEGATPGEGIDFMIVASASAILGMALSPDQFEMPSGAEVLLVEVSYYTREAAPSIYFDHTNSSCLFAGTDGEALPTCWDDGIVSE